VALYFSRIWSKVLIRLAGIKIILHGKENIPEIPAAVIYIANHQSLFDIPLLYAYIPQPFLIMAKKSLFQIPFFGWHLYLSGTISIDRANPVKAAGSFYAAAKKIKKNNSLLLFPEGTRSANQILLPFKKGAFLLAKRTKSIIVPIVIKGTHSILPKGSLIIRKNAVTLIFLPPISQEKVITHSADEISAMTWELMNSHMHCRINHLIL
ncbi:MAG: hypothetical protein A2Y62_06790, partial [Candidatus Fischerbacteria bacterium RBG_13_37_8]